VGEAIPILPLETTMKIRTTLCLGLALAAPCTRLMALTVVNATGSPLVVRAAGTANLGVLTGNVVRTSDREELTVDANQGSADLNLTAPGRYELSLGDANGQVLARVTLVHASGTGTTVEATAGDGLDLSEVLSVTSDAITVLDPTNLDAGGNLDPEREEAVQSPSANLRDNFWSRSGTPEPTTVPQEASEAPGLLDNFASEPNTAEPEATAAPQGTPAPSQDGNGEPAPAVMATRAQESAPTTTGQTVEPIPVSRERGNLSSRPSSPAEADPEGETSQGAEDPGRSSTSD
jgi:hypothetical protein